MKHDEGITWLSHFDCVFYFLTLESSLAWIFRFRKCLEMSGNVWKCPEMSGNVFLSRVLTPCWCCVTSHAYKACEYPNVWWCFVPRSSCLVITAFWQCNSSSKKRLQRFRGKGALKWTNFSFQKLPCSTIFPLFCKSKLKFANAKNNLLFLEGKTLDMSIWKFPCFLEALGKAFERGNISGWYSRDSRKFSARS